MTARLLVASSLLVLLPASAEAGSCDVQDEGGGGCMAGECCYLGPEEAPICVTAGAGGQDAACLASPDCTCAHVCAGPEDAGACAKWCGTAEPDSDLCEPPARCTRRIVGAGGGSLGFACKTPDDCNPLLQDCPDDGDGCYVTDPEVGTTDCAPAGDGVQNEECASLGDCAAGYACANGVCMRICNPDNGNADCAEGSCVDRGWTVPGGTDPIGYCVPEGGPDADTDTDGDTDSDSDTDADSGGCGCRTTRPVGLAALLPFVLVPFLRRKARRA